MASNMASSTLLSKDQVGASSNSVIMVITHRIIQTNGIKMHIAEQGSGPVVLLLHGFPELWYSWRHQIPVLAAAGYHAVAPDMRGYGYTDAPLGAHNYTYFHIVGDLIGLLDALGVEKAFVVGHDWGSVIASHLCLFRPDRVKALVNLSVALSPRDPTTKPTEKMKTAFGEGYYMLRFQEPGRVEEEFARHGCTTVVKRFLLMTSTALFVAPPEKGIIDVIETQSTIPSWITEEEIQYFAKKFEKTGFTGGLNYYRAIDLARTKHVSDMCSYNVEAALANLDLNDLVLELVTFDDGDPLKSSSYTLADRQIGLDIEEEEGHGGESNGSDADFDDTDMEEDY